jgi:hypothetical protein
MTVKTEPKLVASQLFLLLDVMVSLGALAVRVALVLGSAFEVAVGVG